VVWTILICAPIVAAGIWAGIASLKDEDAQTSDPGVKAQPVAASPAPATPAAKDPDSRYATLAAQKIGTTSRPRPVTATAPTPDQNHALGTGSLVSPGVNTPSALDIGSPLAPSPDDLTIGIQPAKP